MEEGYARREQRPVLIHASRGTLEGELGIGTALRTLDRLNLLHHAFVTIENPRVVAGDWSIEPGTLLLNTSCILFVVELSSRRLGVCDAGEAARFSRSAVRLQVGDYEIQGFLHVPGKGRPLIRLKQDRHAFMAVTSASVVGPDTAFASSFLAVNRAHVLAAQELEYKADLAREACVTETPKPVSLGTFGEGR